MNMSIPIKDIYTGHYHDLNSNIGQILYNHYSGILEQNQMGGSSELSVQIPDFKEFYKDIEKQLRKILKSKDSKKNSKNLVKLLEKMFAKNLQSSLTYMNRFITEILKMLKDKKSSLSKFSGEVRETLTLLLMRLMEITNEKSEPLVKKMTDLFDDLQNMVIRVIKKGINKKKSNSK